MSVSGFYYACRNGDIDKVQTLLDQMSATEIDCMESNGSTALHAATYYGHIDIVRLLLSKGASRNQKNKYDKTPAEETSSPEIVQLFQNVPVININDRIISDVFSAISHHRRFYSFSQGPPSLSYVVNKLLNAKELNFDEPYGNMTEVKEMFQDALAQKDAGLLVRAYMMESSFFVVLNKMLASYHELTDAERESPPWHCAFARLLASDEPALRPYRWTGISYRGLSIPKDWLAQWQVGKIWMNKTFLSTTKNIKVAMDISRTCQKKEGMRSTIFEYRVKDDRAVLDINMLLGNIHEEEVLILPCMDFEIIEIDNSGEVFKMTLLLR